MWSKPWILLIVFLIVLGGCQSATKAPVDTATAVTAPQAVSRVSEGNVVEVFYGTNRNSIHADDSPIVFGAEYTSTIKYGSLFVSLPPGHKTGVTERPWFRWMKPDPEKHMVLEWHKPYKNFSEFSGAIKSQPKNKMFIFIHGYNVKFEDAAFRTAQMAYDLEFEGAPVFFSWPSNGDILGYIRDKNNAERTIPHITMFLDGLIKNAPEKEIYIIAHSMGTGSVSQAITSLLRSNPDARSKIKEVILAAPDIDVDVFTDQIMPAFSDAELPVTVYTSNRDRALMLSSWLHGYTRVGVGIPGTKNLEVIDASYGDIGFFRHSYFSESIRILFDINGLIEKNLRADFRKNLKRVEAEEGPYWMITEAERH